MTLRSNPSGAAARLERSLRGRLLPLSTAVAAARDDLRLSTLHQDLASLWGTPLSRARPGLLFDYLRIYYKRRLSWRGVIDDPTTEYVLRFSLQVANYRRLEIMFRELFIERCYDFELTGASPLIIDAGANIGLATLFFKYAYPDSRVLAFEPEPTAFELLEQNMHRNKVANVRLFNMAVYDHDGTVPLYFDATDPASLTSSTVYSRMPTQALDVPCTRLSTHITEPISLLKMDVEGAETVVLEELADSGKMQLVHEMVIEFHHHADGRDVLSRALDILERAGFGYQVCAPRGPGFYSRGVQQDVLLHAYRRDDV